MSQTDFKKYLIQFLFQHPELIELKYKNNYYFDNKIIFDISSTIKYIEEEINKKEYCLINVRTHNKMYDVIIQFFKIMENNQQIKSISPTLTNINKLLKCINQVREILNEFKLKKLIIFKLMFNKKIQNIVGIIGIPVNDGTWIFLMIDIIYLIVNTSLFKYLEKGNK